MLQAGILNRGNCRFLDSLYHPAFPELTYNVNNKETLAPWITLPAQEILLDIGLSNYTVVEYGSGMSTFFFTSEAIICYSFEDDKDPAGYLLGLPADSRLVYDFHQECHYMKGVNPIVTAHFPLNVACSLTNGAMSYLNNSSKLGPFPYKKVRFQMDILIFCQMALLIS